MTTKIEEYPNAVNQQWHGTGKWGLSKHESDSHSNWFLRPVQEASIQQVSFGQSITGTNPLQWEKMRAFNRSRPLTPDPVQRQTSLPLPVSLPSSQGKSPLLERSQQNDKALITPVKVGSEYPWNAEETIEFIGLLETSEENNARLESSLFAATSAVTKNLKPSRRQTCATTAVELPKIDLKNVLKSNI